MGDARLPDWWDYPAECRMHHPWGPGKVGIDWWECPCAGDAGGHLEVRCLEPRCEERWCHPAHVEWRARLLRLSEKPDLH